MASWTVRAAGPAFREIDRDAARAALAVLADPAHGVQLQGLPSGRHRIVPGNDPDRQLAAVEALADDRSVYVMLNPVPAGRSEPARAADVLARRWLLVDVDRRKREGDKDLSATDAEREACRAVADRVAAGLGAAGWPAPVVVDSGNGYHLLYRLDLPNDAHGRALLRGVLHVLSGDYSTEAVEVDRKTHNANRISKLPGCWARKGPDTPDRPHRPCRLVYAPEAPEPVPVELLAKAAGVEGGGAAPPPDGGRGEAFRVRAQSGRDAAYGRRALEGEVARVCLARPGERNDTLNRAAFALGQLVGGGLLKREEVESSLLTAARRSGLGDREAAATVGSGLAAGLAQPRGAPERNGVHPAPPPLDPGTAVVVRASSITPRKVEWLWPGRIPLGKLTTFAGVGGLGKTFVLLECTARVTKGLDWPDSAGECQEVGNVLFVSGEDDPDDTLVPRLIEMGADLDRVFFLTTAAQDQFKLADLTTLDAACDQAGGVRFVAIDPPTAYLGGVDDHKNAELRSLLSPLKNWAARRRCAVVFNTHVNKPQGSKVEAMMRVMGSVAWVNAVRAAHMFARDPDDPTRERRLFVGMKLNIGRERRGLAYRIVSTDSLARVEWLGEVDTTADQAINADRKPREVNAIEWLATFFRDRTEAPSSEVFQRAREAGLSEMALKEAKAALKVAAERRFGIGVDGKWFWRWTATRPLPPGAEAEF